MPDQQDIAAELVRLRKLRAKRSGALGWEQNVKAIDAAIALLETPEEPDPAPVDPTPPADDPATPLETS